MSENIVPQITWSYRDLALDETLSQAQQFLRDGRHDHLSRAVAVARDRLKGASEKQCRLCEKRQPCPEHGRTPVDASDWEELHREATQAIAWASGEPIPLNYVLTISGDGPLVTLISGDAALRAALADQFFGPGGPQTEAHREEEVARWNDVLDRDGHWEWCHGEPFCYTERGEDYAITIYPITLVQGDDPARAGASGEPIPLQESSESAYLIEGQDERGRPTYWTGLIDRGVRADVNYDPWCAVRFYRRDYASVAQETHPELQAFRVVSHGFVRTSSTSGEP
jgi:hypothetical protein